MKKNLYDLLEVSPTASLETIQAVYQRLSAQFDPDAPGNIGNDEAAIRHQLLKDAYHTLSDPSRRAAYDQTLEARNAIVNAEVVEPFWNGRRILLAVALLAVAVGFVSWRQVEAERARVEQERLLAEQQEMAQRAQQESAQAQLEHEKRQEAARQQAEFERARYEADWRQRQRESAEQYAQRQAQYQKDAEERKRQMEERERERRARQEQYENERRLRQMEYERSSGRVVVLPKP